MEDADQAAMQKLASNILIYKGCGLNLIKHKALGW